MCLFACLKRAGRLRLSLLRMRPDPIPRDVKGRSLTCTTEIAHVNIQPFLWQHFLSLGKWLHENK